MMLIDTLRQQEKYYMDNIQRANKFTSIFRGHQDHHVKLNAVRKLMKDISLEDVWYTKKELDLLNSGKLRDILQKHQHELPVGFVNSKAFAKRVCL